MTLAAALLGGGMKPFCRSIERLHQWNANEQRAN